MKRIRRAHATDRVGGRPASSKAGDTNTAGKAFRLLLAALLACGLMLTTPLAWAEELREEGTASFELDASAAAALGEQPDSSEPPALGEPPASAPTDPSEPPASDPSLLTPQATGDPTVVDVLADTQSDYVARRRAIEDQRRAFSDGVSRYTVLPSVHAPYAAGVLTQEYIQDSLHSLNFVRYLAGLPNDVDQDANYGAKAQAGAVLLAASNFAHYPVKPGDMDQAFYDQGLAGTSSSNIAMGYGSLQNAIIDGWAEDSDTYNIDVLGHRRWVLNPAMAKTGFGDANVTAFGGYQVMYAFDGSRAQAVDYEAIAYPSGQAFPSNVLFGTTAWSITLNPALYQTPTLSDITVTLTNGTNTWNFSASDGNKNGKFFNVDTNGYGVPNCIIFRPDNLTSYSGTYTVTVNGIRTSAGLPASMQYSVNFFAFDDAAPTLKPRSVRRDSESAATINFTSDEPGSYYYAFVPRGTAAPAIDTSGAGTPMIASEQSFTVSGLEAHTGYDLYLVGKDASGNVSGPLKIGIPTPPPPIVGAVIGKAVTLSTALAGGRNIDIPGRSTKQGEQAIIWSDTVGANQRFYVGDAGGGAVYLQNVNSGLVLDINGANISKGAAIIQWPYKGSNNQKWYIEEGAGGSGTYVISSVLNPSYCLDIYGGQNANGAKLILWERTGGANQSWDIAPITPSLADGTYTI
ncbi:MAG: RICIN domain-containing protein, partial [Coriobacteriales bacterium]|nr:RICIN domain-containing protein [Coriobacteriales bacterium]